MPRGAFGQHDVHVGLDDAVGVSQVSVKHCRTAIAEHLDATLERRADLWRPRRVEVPAEAPEPQ